MPHHISGTGATTSGSGRIAVGVGRAARQDEAPVAITAFDETLFVDAEKDARVAERGADITATVAMDGIGGDSNDFGRRLHNPCRLATTSRRFNKLWGAY